MPTTLISATTPIPQERVGNETIYLRPRMSANQLAQFVVSEAAKQETIVRDAKRVMAVRVANYQPARHAMALCHRPDGIDATLISSHAARMRETLFTDEYERQCNELSAASFLKFAPLASQIDCAGRRISTPKGGFDHLLIEGVRVSVQPEIVVSFTHRGVAKFGGVIFNFSKGDYSSLENGNSKYKAGDYAAVLLFLMLGVRFGGEGGPRNANCFAVDVYRERIFTASASHKTMLKNLEAACRNIARQWDAEVTV